MKEKNERFRSFSVVLFFDREFASVESVGVGRFVPFGHIAAIRACAMEVKRKRFRLGGFGENIRQFVEFNDEFQFAAGCVFQLIALKREDNFFAERIGREIIERNR